MGQPNVYEMPGNISDVGPRLTKCRLLACTRLPLVAVPMVHVRVVGVDVAHRLMAMPMGMRLRHGAIVLMLVMFVVDVTVLMLQRLVRVFVRMPLRQVQPQTYAHQPPGDQQLRRHQFAKQGDRHDRAHEWRQGVICARARAAEMAQRQNEHDETDPDPKQPDEPRRRDGDGARECRSRQQGEPHVDAPCDQSLEHCNDDGVGR